MATIIKKGKFRLLHTLLGLALLAALLWLADIKELAAAFRGLTVESVVYLLLMSVVLIYVSAIKWGLFLEAFSASVSVFCLFRLYLVGYFVNLVLPSYLGGDAVRSWYVGKSVGQHGALAATILERYTGLVAMLILGFGASFMQSFVPWQVRAAIVALGLGLAVVTVIALSEKTIAIIDSIKFLHPAVKHLEKIQEAFHLARKDHLLLIKSLGYSFLYHLLTVVNTIVCAVAVGWQDPSFMDLVVVLPLILIAGAIPLAPNGLGIQEGAFFYFLSQVGATPAQALGIALLLRAKSYIIAFLGYFAWLGQKAELPEHLQDQDFPSQAQMK